MPLDSPEVDPNGASDDFGAVADDVPPPGPHDDNIDEHGICELHLGDEKKALVGEFEHPARDIGEPLHLLENERVGPRVPAQVLNFLVRRVDRDLAHDPIFGLPAQVLADRRDREIDPDQLVILEINLDLLGVGLIKPEHVFHLIL